MQLKRWRYVLPLRLRSILRPRQVEQDLDDEIQYHLEQQVHELTAKGIDPEEAWRAVRRNFGRVDLAKEECRDARGVHFIDTLRQDTRYACRTLRRNPGFALVAILTLALGIGVNSAVFSLVDGILLARLPYSSPDSLVSVNGTYPNGAFAAMREEVATLDAAAYAEGRAFTLEAGGDPARVTGARVSAELFSILGVKPALGRWLQPSEDAVPGDRYVVLSHPLWMETFRGDPTVVGRSIRVDGVAREVIAVMPPSFQFPSARTQLWVPLGLDPRDTVSYWAGDFMPIVGRLRPGVTMADAQAELRLFQSRIGARFPWPMPSDWNRNLTVLPLRDALVGPVRPRLLILIAAVALVLIVACANVANMALARAMARDREIWVRTAIGASPRRIARQLLTESIVLAGIGAAAGLLLAGQVLAITKLVLPSDTPRLSEVALNWRAFAFTGILAVLTGCAFGLAPVLQALRTRPGAVSDSSGRGGGHGAVAAPIRSALVIAQVACAVLLVTTAGLLVRSLWSLSRTDPGFESDGVVTARISPTDTLCAVPEQCLAFYRSLADQAANIPGIREAGLVNTLPLTGSVAKRSLQIEGLRLPPSETAPLFWLTVVTPGYFRVLDLGLESGRLFMESDLSGRPAVAIVSSSTARRFWPGRRAVGQHVRFVGEAEWREIVGVVADVRGHDLTRDLPEWMTGLVYVPHAPNATMEDGRIPTEMTVALKTSMEPVQVGETMRRLAGAKGGAVAVTDVRTMKSVLASAVAAPASTASLLVTLAGLALVLGAIGVYGVLSFLVSRQRRDLGIRLALGAEPRDLIWVVVKEGGMLCGTGALLGFAGALAVGRWMSSQLYGVSPTDPLTYVVVAFVVAAITVAACYLPSRRAISVDPLIVLRDQ